MGAFIARWGYSSKYVAAAACLFSLAYLPPSGPQSPVIGMVLKIHGRVCHPSQSNRDSYELDPQGDIANPILDGELFRVEKGSWVRIQIGHDVIDIDSKKSPYRMHPNYTMTDREKEYARAINADFAASGPQAGARGVWEPSLGSAVRASTATIRWTFSGGVVHLTLKDASDHVIWSASSVDTSRGELSETKRYELQAALEALQEQSKGTPLTLTTKRVGGINQEIPFSVISRTQERLLEERLKEADQVGTDPIPQAVAKGQIFSEFSMYADSALEFQNALKLAPRSTHLLRATIRVLQTTGNTTRAAELQTQLTDDPDVRARCTLQ